MVSNYGGFFKDLLKKMAIKYLIRNESIHVLFLKCRSEFGLTQATVRRMNPYLFGSCLLRSPPTSVSCPPASCALFGLSASEI